MISVDEVELIEFREGEKLGTQVEFEHLNDVNKRALIEFPQNNMDLFAWKPKKMLGIYLKLMSHRLNVDYTKKPV